MSTQTDAYRRPICRDLYGMGIQECSALMHELSVALDEAEGNDDPTWDDLSNLYDVIHGLKTALGYG